MPKGYMYILECRGGFYYTGSTVNLKIRLAQHEAGEGANFTKKFLPVKLVYFEAFSRIDTAFYREKQVQKWSRKKKKALIDGDVELLKKLARSTKSQGAGASTSSATRGSTPFDPSTSSGTEGSGTGPSTSSGAGGRCPV